LYSILLKVYKFNKNLNRMHHNDGTNMRMLYLFCNYHMLLLLHLGKGLYCTISLHVYCCKAVVEVELIQVVEQ